MSIFDLPMLSAITRRRLALLVSLAVVMLALVLAWQFISVLVPYALSAMIAFLIMPVVDFLAARLPGHRRHPRLTRAIAAGLGMVLVLAVGGAVLAIVLFRIVEGTSALAEQIPRLLEEVRLTSELLERAYRDRVPPDIQAMVDPRIEGALAAIVAAASDAAVQAIGVLRSGLSLAIALAGAPIILFYLLYDARAIGRGIRVLLPGPLREDLANMGGLAGTITIAYIRTQLILAIMVSVVIALALWGLGVPAAILLGLAAGLGELIPIVGPIAAFGLAAIVVLVVNIKLLPVVALIYLVVQVLQNSLVTPRLQGNATGLHPLGIMLSVAFLGALWGFWGILIAVPLVAAAYRVLTYVREVWNAPVADDGSAEGGSVSAGISSTSTAESPPPAAE